MKDQILRAYNSEVRVVAIRTTETVEEARARHGTSATATAALGRTMTGALLLASNLEEEKEAVSVTISGDGPLGKIAVDASPTGGVRGYVDNPFADAPSKNGKLDVGTIVGQGSLTVTRLLSNGENFSGSTSLVSGEIAEDFTHYLLSSEQIPSMMSLGVLINPDLSVQSAGGFFIQALPGASDETLERIEKNVFILPPISQMITEGNTLEEIISFIFGGLPYESLEAQPVGFFCSCSREKMEQGLISLGKDELKTIANEDDNTELRCHFCEETYDFTSQEIAKLADEIQSKN